MTAQPITVRRLVPREYGTHSPPPSIWSGAIILSPSALPIPASRPAREEELSASSVASACLQYSASPASPAHDTLSSPASRGPNSSIWTCLSRATQARILRLFRDVTITSALPLQAKTAKVEAVPLPYRRTCCLLVFPCTPPLAIVQFRLGFKSLMSIPALQDGPPCMSLCIYSCDFHPIILRPSFIAISNVHAVIVPYCHRSGVSF